MSSSMLTGERRFAPRRGAMTVLGKVTVPKPINLPSQKLENQGLDPNVEIVPKGTLSWGGKSTAASQNAWGSPTDGLCSPSHLNGRPSSGGSGTRPSTAGSENSHEPASNAWGPNSRPSSASGVLGSNLSSMVSTRPQSAEHRPGSSQLSRFAEPISQSSATWGSAGAAEKLGTSSSKKSGFALSSGDFPTLGSEKSTESHPNQGHSSQGRLASASSRAATPKEKSDILSTEEQPYDASTERSTTAWKEGNPLYVDGGHTSGPENWHREPHVFPNHCMPPQHFDPRHGAPVRNPSDGVWFRGPSHGPPFRGPSPGNYPPNEPYPYYHPQIPTRPFANQQPGPRVGSNPTGPYPKQGDPYRQCMPDSFVRPGMPVRPGVYPGPVPFDGYYGPHAGFHHLGERDAPMMGMQAGPNFYNRYPNQNFHPRPGGYGTPTSIPVVRDQVESGNPSDNYRGPYKVLLKQQDSLGESDGLREQHMKREKDYGVDYRKHEAVNILTIASQSVEAPHGGQYPNSVAKAKLVEEGMVNKPEVTSILGDGSEQVVHTKKDPTLFDKIAGLNTKVRNIDRKYNTGHGLTGEEKIKSYRVMSVRDDYFTKQAGNFSVSSERISSNAHGTNASRQVNRTASKSTQVFDSQAIGPSAVHKVSENSGSDNQGKGKADVLDCHAMEEALEKPTLNLQERSGEGFSGTSVLDPREYLAQRLKMKEIATQRAKQREEEEELRSKQQKAKALAKLEELNKKTLGQERSAQIDTAASANSEASVSRGLRDIPLISNSLSTTQMKDVSTSKPEEPTGLPEKMQCEIPIFGSIDFAAVKSILPVKANSVVSTDHKSQPVMHNANSTRQNQAVHLKNQSKNSSEKTTPSETSKDFPAPGVDDRLPQQKKRNSRNYKNKQKSNEADSSLVLSVQPEASESLAPNQGSVNKKLTDVPHGHAVNQGWSLPTLEVHNQSRPQANHKVVRNTHASKPVENVWAPVRSQGNNEVAESQGSNEVFEEATKNTHAVQNNHKNRRAEMERYVPKLIARDTLVNHTISDAANVVDSRFPCTKDSHLSIGKDVENKRNKQGKIQGAWRQRSSTESSSAVQVPSGPLDESSVSLDNSKVPYKPMEQEKQKEKPKVRNGWDSPERIPAATEAIVSLPMKEYVATGTRKLQPQRGYEARGTDCSRSHCDDSCGVDLINTDTRPSSSEHHDSGEHVTSRWKPKSPPHNQQTNRGSGISRDNKWEESHNLDEVARRDSFKQGPTSINKQNASGELRRHGSNNNRPDRRQEQLPAGISAAGQENSRPANIERLRHTNSHYEYQPVRSYNSKPRESYGEGSSFRGRGRGQGRHGGGNFHVRQGSANDYVE